MNTIPTTNKKDKFYFRLVLVISVLVFTAVILLNRKVLPRPEVIPSFTYFLPMLNAFINGTCSILLLLSLYFIKRKNIAAHKTTNIITFLLSSIFLVLYVMFHYFADETKFPAENSLRPYYLFILITHIILAASVLPLILLSFYYGLGMQVAKHRKLVRWAFPIWLYVTVTGVVVYLMISPYYPF
ncbi:MAG: hypothetical protein A3F72_03785 [Bacteroidetes bacterium RIFCSPLOWO2_12_FULL_35_15]|nr:MAG: hypothetical protein A3F72_03785 [Bacteroidetes bacterium RIFCSPLOWO2_12_FULL_35_15]